MTNYREILRLYSLGINNTKIAENVGCSRPTVVNALVKAQDQGIDWRTAAELSDRELYEKLSAGEKVKSAYKMPNMNAYIESYHSILEDDFMQQTIFESFEDVVKKLDRYVKYYNKVRIHGSLGYLSPEEYYNQYNLGELPPVEVRL